VLVADGLVFSYADRHVFNGLSVGFERGLTWLQGANGSGKSTLLKLLGGVLAPAGGRLSVSGIDAAQQPLDYRRHVFWCGPGPIAFGHLRAPEYFGFLQGLYPRFDAAAIGTHIDGFALGAQLNAPIRMLSTGTQRKVWLTAALVAGTAAVLLDEPLNALDAPSLAHARQALAAGHARAAQAWVVASHEAPCDVQGVRELRLP
jgi:ABC-type multidrug transport system ATPase subunit